MSTFGLDGYKLILHDQNDNKVSITAICELTSQTFSVEQHTLVNIKPITIEAALKRENPALTYTLLREENALELKIKINLEYMPSIEESIFMKLRGKEAAMKAVLSQIKVEAESLYKQIGQLEENKMVIFKQLEGPITQSEMFRVQLPAGAYLVEGNGLALSSYENYNEEYGQDYNGQFNFKGRVNISIMIYEQKQAKVMAQISTAVNTMCSMQTPIFFTKAVQLSKAGSIAVQITSQSLYQSHIRNFKLTVTQAVLTSIN